MNALILTILAAEVKKSGRSPGCRSWCYRYRHRFPPKVFPAFTQQISFNDTNTLYINLVLGAQSASSQWEYTAPNGADRARGFGHNDARASNFLCICVSTSTESSNMIYLHLFSQCSRVSCLFLVPPQ